MTTADLDRLRHIHTFPQLIKYLKDELDWPITTDDVDELMFEYKPEELGIDPKNEVKINKIRQLRPLVTNQPWGIFFIEFEPKRLPVVALRRILRGLVIRKRRSTEKPQQATWQLHDLLFISSYGESEQRSLSFAHFSEDPETGDLPVLRVLGWDDRDTLLHLGHAHETLEQKLQWPDNEDDIETWRSHWASAFTLRHREVITTSKSLAEHLARLARRIRNIANEVMAIESESGPLRKLYEGFKEALIHDLSGDDFADMYAQTIAYGLLTARVSRPAGLVADNLSDMVPITNPFLKELLETFLSAGGRRSLIDFDELGVNDVVELLREANMEAVLRDFGDQAPGEDPVIHFYERFLKEYDPVKRIKRGVFYTPRLVVSFIVRSVDEILRREFGLEDGLADTTTWGEIAERQSGIEIPEHVSPEMYFVQILDPAVGTGTFLVEAINVIHKTMLEKWRNAGYMELELPKLWNEYVPTFLLPRLFGFELMMAPYAIAHMKVGLKLAETGYRFGTDERAKIYLTNSLEPPHGLSSQVELYAPALAHEAAAVNAVKDQQRFTVVIGNPPYSILSQNLTETARAWVDAYRFVDGEKIVERGALQFEKNLQDDYVKFIRFGECQIKRAGLGVLGYITNHGYIDNPTFRGMRQSLIGVFNNIRVLDLHGNSLKGEVSPDGKKDFNVFDIQQGVAISLLSRVQKISFDDKQRIFYGDLWGSRDSKNYWLASNIMREEDLQTVSATQPDYLLIAQDETHKAEYLAGWRISDLFHQYGAGIVTARDRFVIDHDPSTLVRNATEFRDAVGTDSEVCRELGIKLKKGWNIIRSRRLLRDETDLQRFVRPLLYRPFDFRFIFYHKSLIWGMSYPTMQHMCPDTKKNIGLVISRSVRGAPWRDILASRFMIEFGAMATRPGNSAPLFPLYIFPATGELDFGSRRILNLSSEFVREFSDGLSLQRLEEGRGDLLPHGTIGPEDVLTWVYSQLYSQGYRDRYSEFLRMDFPRIFQSRNLPFCRTLVHLGHELMSLHILESLMLDDHITTLVGSGELQVEMVSYSDETVWTDKAKTRGFRGVPKDVWNFHIGGYQVCEKGLNDHQAKVGMNPRPGRVFEGNPRADTRCRALGSPFASVMLSLPVLRRSVPLRLRCQSR